MELEESEKSDGVRMEMGVPQNLIQLWRWSGDRLHSLRLRTQGKQQTWHNPGNYHSWGSWADRESAQEWQLQKREEQEMGIGQ